MKTPAPSPQADGSPDPLHKAEKPPAGEEKGAHTVPGAADGHIGATEDEVSDTPAPAGENYSDEPKQG
jgi:hypothetical protein